MQAVYFFPIFETSKECILRFRSMSWVIMVDYLELIAVSN